MQTFELSSETLSGMAVIKHIQVLRQKFNMPSEITIELAHMFLDELKQIIF